MRERCTPPFPPLCPLARCVQVIPALRVSWWHAAALGLLAGLWCLRSQIVQVYRWLGLFRVRGWLGLGRSVVWTDTAQHCTIGVMQPKEHAVITITHTHASGTLIEGSHKGDGVYEILRGLRGNWRYFPSLRQIGLGQSRDRAAKTWDINQAAEALRAAGHEVTVTIDESDRRSFATAEAERYERAGSRAQYHEDVAGSAEARADAAYRAEHGILDGIPAGQPILVGHHSERRHRRDLDRAESLRRKARDESERAEYHADRAEVAARFQARREDIPTTLRRIKKLEADERRLRAGLTGRPDYYQNEASEWKCRLIKPEGDYLARLEASLADVREALAYWREHVRAAEESGVKVWTCADFAKGDFARRHGQWVEVIRVNAKSLTVPAILDMRPVATKAGAQYSWTDTLPYDEVTGRTSAADMAALLATAGSGTAGAR